MRLKKITVTFIAAFILFSLLLFLKHYTVPQTLISIIQKITTIYKNNSLNPQTKYKTIKIENIITQRLQELEVPRQNISILHFLEDSSLTISASIPRGKPMELILWYICSTINRAGYKTKDCYYQKYPFKCFAEFDPPKRIYPIVKLKLKHSRKYFSKTAEMAIVLQDFSYEATPTISGFFSFEEPLTIALLSPKKMAVSCADIAHEHDKEIILLLPMEPLQETYRLYHNKTIMLHFTSEKISAIINQLTKHISYYAGFSNLGGTRILGDSRILNIVLSEVKKKNSYFLANNVPHQATFTMCAEKLDVPYRVTDIDLDSNFSASDNVLDTLRHAALIAQKKGSVILSARPTKQFLGATTELLSYFRQNGIQLVTVSELMYQSQQ